MGVVINKSLVSVEQTNIEPILGATPGQQCAWHTVMNCLLCRCINNWPNLVWDLPSNAERVSERAFNLGQVSGPAKFM